MFNVANKSANGALVVVPPDEIEELLFRLIETPSHQDAPGFESGVVELLRGWLADRGVDTETPCVLDGRCNLIARLEGDGTGRDIWRASVRVFDAAVGKAYQGARKIEWKEVLAGEKAFNTVNNWLPDETVDAFRKYLVGIKGPLTTPIGGGIRSLNVALRQLLDLYVCLRPVRWFQGVPSPVKHPEKVDMVIFRENTEDLYSGIEFEQGTEDNKKFMEMLKINFPKHYARIRFPDTSGIGLKNISIEKIIGCWSFGPENA